MTDRCTCNNDDGTQTPGANPDCPVDGYTPLNMYELGDPDSGVDWQDLSCMKTLTCVNHPTAVYLTKNPWMRGIHVIKFPEGFEYKECPCPFSDLRVMAP